MKGLIAAALVESALIAWRDLHNDKVMPIPSDFVAVAIVYGGLGLLPDSGAGFAAAVGWGLVLATFLNLWDPKRPLNLTGPAAGQGAQTQ